MICPQCSTEAPQGNDYCGKCGFPLHARLAAPVPKDTAVRREITVILAGVALVFASVAIGWIVFFGQRTPQAAVRRFLDAEANGRMADAGRYVRKSTDSQLILSVLQTYRQQSGTSVFKGSRIDRTDVSGDTAQVYVTLAIAPPATTPGQPLFGATITPPNVVPFQLIREDGEWKIDATVTAMNFTTTWLAASINQFGKGLPNWTFPGNRTVPAPNIPQLIPNPTPGPQPSPTTPNSTWL